MEDPCEKCIVNTTCEKFITINCQKLWDYKLWKFGQQILLEKLIEENKKLIVIDSVIEKGD